MTKADDLFKTHRKLFRFLGNEKGQAGAASKRVSVEFDTKERLDAFITEDGRVKFFIHDEDGNGYWKEKGLIEWEDVEVVWRKREGA